MPVTLVQTASDFTTPFASSKTVTFSSNNTGGNSIVVVVAIPGQLNDTFSTISDTKGNTYVTEVTQGTANNPVVKVLRANNIAAGANSVTVTLTGSDTWALVAYETTPLGTTDKTSTGTGTSSSPSTGSVTTTANGEFCVAGFGESGGSGASFTAGSGWTLTGQNGQGAAVEQQVQSSAGAITGNCTLNFSPTWGAAMATFPAAGGAIDHDKTYNIDAFIKFDTSKSYNVDAFIAGLNSKSYNIDAFIFIPQRSYNIDAFIFIPQRSYNIDAFITTPVTVQVQYVKVVGTILFKISPNAFINIAGTVLQPARQFINVTATIVSKPAPNFVNVAAAIQLQSRQFLKVIGTVSSDKLKTYSIDAAIATVNNRQFINVAANIVAPLQRGPCGNYPDAVFVKVAGWIINPGNDSIQMPGQGFTKQDDWLSSQDAAASYKPGSIFTIFGSTLPTAGISLIVSAFTAGVVSFQTRTRTWLRRVDAAPSGILLTTKVNKHTLPNGAIITTTTQVQQVQDTLVTTVTIQNSATPLRTSTIVTEKTASGQTVTRESDTNITNGIINTLTKKNVTTAPPNVDNIQPLQVRTLDGVIHYQFFSQINQEWAGGEVEGLTTISKQVQIVPTSFNGKYVDQFGNPIYKQTTTELETDPTGKVTQTTVEEIGTRRDIGTTTIDTQQQFNGIQTTTVKTTNYPDGSKNVSTTVTNALTGDSTETDVETVTDEFGQITVTTTNIETKTFPDPSTGIIRQQVLKTVTVNKGGVVTVDNTVETNDDFEDSIADQKIKVYGIQEFTITCTIDEFSMEALSEINLTHQKNYALLELFGQQLGNLQLSYGLRQTLIRQFNQANSCIAPVTLQALGRQYRVVFAQSASAFRAKYIPGTEPHVYEIQMILQSRSDLINGAFGT